MIEHDGGKVHLCAESYGAVTGKANEERAVKKGRRGWKKQQNGEMKELFAESTVEVEGGADECEMGKGLWKVSKSFAMMAGFFSI